MTYEELIKLGVEGAGREKTMKERMAFLKAEIPRLQDLIRKHDTELYDIYDQLNSRIPSWLCQIQKDIQAAIEAKEKQEEDDD